MNNPLSQFSYLNHDQIIKSASLQAFDCIKAQNIEVQCFFYSNKLAEQSAWCKYYTIINFKGNTTNTAMMYKYTLQF